MERWDADQALSSGSVADVAQHDACGHSRSESSGKSASPRDPRLARSRLGMVTSPHELASQAGLEVLRTGGNAIEAAIATSASLSVTYPHFTGLGGDAFMLVANARGEVISLSGIGQSAAQLPSFSGRDALPVRGAQSMLTSAGNVDTLGQAWEYSRDELGGEYSWASLLAHAGDLARDGFPFTASGRFWLDYRRQEMDKMPGVATAFHPDGRAPEVGACFRQPALATTLASLANEGYRSFYQGSVAERLAAGLRAAGSPLRMADLAATRARREAPLSLPYRKGTLLAHQPPTQGVTTLQIMGILDRFDLASVPEGSADYYHLLVEAVKLAFIERDQVLADPEHAQVPCQRLLDARELNRWAAAIDMRRARAWPHCFRQGDTAFIGTADAAGNAVALLQTVYFDWGSGVMAGDTGVLWHNRGAAFSLDPKHPNCLAPGKRPMHTLNPGVYVEQGRPRMVYGTQGADGQPQTLAAILTRLIDYGMDPLQALARPRFLLGRTFSDSADTLKLEQDAGSAVMQELAQRGHEVAPLPAQSPLAGQPGVIVLERDGSMQGAHDPRSDGRALGL